MANNAPFCTENLEFFSDLLRAYFCTLHFSDGSYAPTTTKHLFNWLSFLESVKVRLWGHQKWTLWNCCVRGWLSVTKLTPSEHWRTWLWDGLDQYQYMHCLFA